MADGAAVADLDPWDEFTDIVARLIPQLRRRGDREGVAAASALLARLYGPAAPGVVAASVEEGPVADVVDLAAHGEAMTAFVVVLVVVGVGCGAGRLLRWWRP